MKTLGIIGEYNPFHLGHKYLLEKTMKQTGSDVCVSVMSGNFTQRGTPAITNKWERAKTAVDQGVNLVLELPVIYACNSAEYFARGAVKVLEGLGGVDYLAFGSENGNLDELENAAKFLKENKEYIIRAIKEKTKEGLSYPKAREEIVASLNPSFDLSIISEPNNILAIEYLKEIKTLKPVTIKRRGKGYHLSATQMRENFFRDKEGYYEEITKNYYNLVTAKIFQSEPEYLENIISSGQGLGKKLKNEIRYTDSIDSLIESVKSKAYTHTRVSRLLTHLLLGINNEVMKNEECYIRVLALDAKGGKFLKNIKNQELAALPIITNINKEARLYPKIEKTMEKDILASDIYNLITGLDLYSNSDYVKTPYYKGEWDNSN